MREIPASDATTLWPSLMDDVERGETIVITRHGRPIARLVPEATQTGGPVAAIDRIERRRREATQVSVDELLTWRHEGHQH